MHSILRSIRIDIFLLSTSSIEIYVSSFSIFFIKSLSHRSSKSNRKAPCVYLEVTVSDENENDNKDKNNIAIVANKNNNGR